MFFLISITDRAFYQIKARNMTRRSARPSPWKLPSFEVTAHLISAEKLKNSLKKVLDVRMDAHYELLVIPSGCLFNAWTESSYEFK